jgi:hypothetical protein
MRFVFLLAAATVSTSAFANSSLGLAGTCPSSVEISTSGFTSGGTVSVLRANGEGSAVIPTGPCAGTVLGLSTSGLRLWAQFTFDAPPGGQVVRVGPITPASVCDKVIQMVDMTTCEVSNVATF